MTFVAAFILHDLGNRSTGLDDLGAYARSQSLESTMISIEDSFGGPQRAWRSGAARAAIAWTVRQRVTFRRVRGRLSEGWVWP